MRLTYRSKSKDGTVDLRFLLFTFTLTLKKPANRGEEVFDICLLALAMTANFIAWPFFLSLTLGLVGIHLPITFRSWVGLSLLIMILGHFTDHSKSSTT